VGVTITQGDCIEVLRGMADASVHCCVTSPPYFGLRDYGCEGQIGLEPTPDEFVARLVDVFREVRRVLRDDGTLWLNLGDSYAAQGGAQVQGTKQTKGSQAGAWNGEVRRPPIGIKPKDLIGIPWRVAFALQADGWYLRQDIIWAKPNPMPESVRDRCTKSHEYIFLLSKSERYYFDAESIAEPVATSTIERLAQPTLAQQAGSDRVPGKTNGAMKAVVNESARKALRSDIESRHRSSIPGGQSLCAEPSATRNKRSVWTVTTKPFKEAHFATFPPDLIEPCILAGCPVGGLVLDPFGGAGTTGLVADRHGRNAALIELNPEYVTIAKRRIVAGVYEDDGAAMAPKVKQESAGPLFDLV